jgi:hypothetical protein
LREKNFVLLDCKALPPPMSIAASGSSKFVEVTK